MLLLAVGAAAQVRNAADAQAGVYGNSTLVPGQLAVVNAYNAKLSGAEVSFRPAGQDLVIPASVVSTPDFGIVFVVPVLPTGGAQMNWKSFETPTQWSSVVIEPSRLSLFRAGNIGPLRAQNISPSGTYSLNGLATPARPGDAIVLWGTGLGPAPAASVKVTVGGLAQAVLYAGPAPGQPGVDQINFRVSASAPDGCYVPLTVQYGANSVSSFLSKTSDGLPCRHPLRLPVGVLADLDAGKGVNISEVSLTTSIDAAASDRAFREETTSVQQRFFSASTLADYVLPFRGGSQTSCTAVPGYYGANFIFDGSPGQPTTISANPVLGILKSPDGTSRAVTAQSLPLRSADAPLARLPNPYLPGGAWTWAPTNKISPASDSFYFVTPSPVTLNADSPVSLRRDQDQAVAWDAVGLDPTASARVSLRTQQSGLTLVTCAALASSGIITIPARLLAILRAGQLVILTLDIEQVIPTTPGSGGESTAQDSITTVFWRSTNTRPVDVK